MARESAEGRGSFWKMADLFQHLASPFAQRAGVEEFSASARRSPLEVLLTNARSRLVGRRVETELHGARLVFTLSELDASLDAMAGAAGQADDVSLAAEDVEYAGLPFARVTADLGNVHTRIGTRPTLVCAPVDLTFCVTAEQAAFLLERYTTRVAASCVEPGQVRLRLRRHPSWGWMDVIPEVLQGRVTLRAVGVGWRNRACRWRRTLPSKAVPVDLPAQARITGVSVEPGLLRATVRVDEWRIPYSELLGPGRRRR